MIQHVSVDEAPIPIGNICLCVKAMEVTDPCPHYCSFETVRLCYCPGSHEATVAPAHNADAVLIHQVALDQVIDTIHDILKVFSTHVSQHCVGESTSTPLTA